MSNVCVPDVTKKVGLSRVIRTLGIREDLREQSNMENYRRIKEMSRKLYIIEDVHAIDARRYMVKDMVGTVVRVVEESIGPVYVSGDILEGYVSCRSWQCPFHAWYGDATDQTQLSTFHRAIKIKPLQ